MSQQAWKRELDAAANKEGGDGESEEKPKRRAKAKAKAKAKGKAKAKAKSKGTPKKLEKGTVTGKGGSKKRGKEAVPDKPEELITPPPKAPKTKGHKRGTKCENSGMDDSEAKGSGDKGQQAWQKKTFARRYKPTSSWGAALWDALLTAYVSICSMHFKCPSKHEVTWSQTTNCISFGLLFSSCCEIDAVCFQNNALVIPCSYPTLLLLGDLLEVLHGQVVRRGHRFLRI